MHISIQKLIPLIFVVFFAFIPSRAQEQVYDPLEYLEWEENKKLSWSLFTGAPDSSSFGDAGTAVKIQAVPVMEEDRIYYKVHALFSRKKSWFKYQSPELLAHEQLHFDIAELTAREIRKKIAAMRQANIKDLKAYNVAIEVILLKSNKLDAAYDRETYHGILAEKQHEWERKIHFRLRELESFKNTHIFVSSF